jgi:bud emergence protein 1
MKSLRRSLNKEHTTSPPISTPIFIPPLSKPPAATSPPQKVIKALKSYQSAAPQQLSFDKGDFFYVGKTIEIGGQPWHEANNPVTGTRGLVPASYFEELVKGTQ